jgi:hypothetical protein
MKKYYTTSHIHSMADFIEVEVNDRDNYTHEEVGSWVKKYGITEKAQLIWVTNTPQNAAKYQMAPELSDDEEYIAEYNDNPDDYDVEEYSENDGVIIEESYDRDDGYLFILK